MILDVWTVRYLWDIRQIYMVDNWKIASGDEEKRSS